MVRIQTCAWGIVLVLLAAAGPGGCASAPRGEPFQPEVADASHAVIYIYRAPRALGERPVRVFVNQEAVGELRPGQYMARVLAAGTYLIRAEAATSTAKEVKLVQGDAAYLQITGAGKPQIVLPETGQARDRIAHTTRAE